MAKKRKWCEATLAQVLDHGYSRDKDTEYGFAGEQTVRFTDGTAVRVTASYSDSGCPTCGGSSELQCEIYQ